MRRNSLNPAFGSKQIRKKSEGKCRCCGEDNYDLLDVHRIKEGKDGGAYSYWNTVVICTSCHRKQQAGQIKIVAWLNSTAGRLLQWFDEDGVEHLS